MYQFNEQDAYEFARSVGIEAKPKGEQLIFKSCPYCRNQRDKGTFAISLVTGAFNCMRASCGVKGNMITLSQDFEEYNLPREAEEYYRPRKKFKQIKQPTEKIQSKPKAIEFLESRKISKEIAEKYEITTDKERDNVLMFPFFDEKGILQFVKYRKTDFNKEKDSCKEWCLSNCKPILFGMNHCKSSERLVVTEGQMDSLAVAEAFIGVSEIDVVSVPTGAKGFTWVPYCYDFVNRYKEIVIFGDYEKGQMSLLDDFSRRFPGKVKHVRYEDYRDCKDANEILINYGKELVRQCVNKAEYVPVNKVLNISEVKKVEVPRFKSGFKGLDDLLQGGLPFGHLTLLTGVRGQGKSCTGEYIAANAIDQDINTFIYSGELTASNVKEWMDRQVAGQDVCETYNNGGYKEYFIRNTTQEQINAWYDGKCWIYDNTCVADEEEDLLKTMREVILKYNVRVLLIDNLMTAMDSFNSRDDKFEKQSRLVKELVKMSKEYDVAIILVAHKRKRGMNAVDGASENDEVSGSSDITNLASIVIGYGENTDAETKDKYPRLLKCLKNRLTGKCNYSGFLMRYDDRSKRVFGDGDDVNKVFSWKSDNKEFYDYGEETPFD